MPEAISYRRFIRTWAERLAQAGVPDGRRSVEWIVEHVTGWSRVRLFAQSDEVMSASYRDASERLLGRRMEREPLQYILGEAEFYGLKFEVSPAVLIPRPETEIVVDEVLRFPTGDDVVVVDVGTGSGAIACAVKHSRPEMRVIATDVSADALDLARQNARALGLDIEFLLADVFDGGLPDRVGPIDILVSNPPYVPDRERTELEPEVFAFEPHEALFTGDDELRFYRPLVAWARSGLKVGGALVVEVHIDFASEVAALAEAEGLVDVRVVDDLTHRPRVVTARQPRVVIR